MIHITTHAYEKGKERLSLRAAALDTLALRAYTQGIAHKDTTGRLNKYITSLYFKYGKANNTKIYGDVIFLFHGSILLTLYQLPNEYKKSIRKITGRKNEQSSY